jgi:hypothetical protein
VLKHWDADKIFGQLPYLVKAEPFALVVPRKGSEKSVQMLGNVSKPSEILTHNDYDVGAKSLCVFDQL